MLPVVFTILIAAHKRHNALQKLLNSLNNAVHYEDFQINLMISIDSDLFPRVIDLADSFEWKMGTKRVVVHKNKMGLKNHFLWCGDQTVNYENVLFLEEDMVVSPYFIEYVVGFINKYKQDDRIAGASLYSIGYNEMLSTKFIPIDDGNDVFFYQQPYWGKVYTKHKWSLFRQWYDNKNYNFHLLPKNVQNWGVQSFKKLFILYLVETQRFIVFPRISLATNLGEIGEHSARALLEYQVPLLINIKAWRFPDFDVSLAKYDAFQELLPEVIKTLNTDLASFDFYVDINNTKEIIAKKYVVTSRRSRNYLFGYANKLQPPVTNIIMNVPGTDICFSESKDVTDLGKIGLSNRIRLMHESLVRNNIINAKKMLLLLIWTVLKKSKGNNQKHE